VFYIGPSAHTCTRPVEETGFVIKVLGRNLFVALLCRYPSETTLGYVEREWRTIASRPPFSLYNMFHPTNQSKVLSGFLFFFPHILSPPSRLCITTLILICCHSSVPLPPPPNPFTNRPPPPTQPSSPLPQFRVLPSPPPLFFRPFSFFFFSTSQATLPPGSILKNKQNSRSFVDTPNAGFFFLRVKPSCQLSDSRQIMQPLSYLNLPKFPIISRFLFLLPSDL
jgi:hypothetical protein